MNEDITERQDASRRTLSIFCVGDTADEIELTALDEARAFFGDDRQLEVVRDYQVFAAAGSALEQSGKTNGKAYYTRLIVRTVEP